MKKYVIKSLATGLYFSGEHSFVHSIHLANIYSQYSLSRFLIKAYLEATRQEKFRFIQYVSISARFDASNMFGGRK
jgi:hypothetical protein